MSSQQFLIIIVILGFLVLFMVGLFAGMALGKKTGRTEAEREFPERLAAEREDAIKRSRAVLGGQLAEQVAPFLPDFPCDPAEVRFLGKPVDFVGFPGISEGEAEEILFIEVKSGSAGLSRAEKSIKSAVVDGRIRWIEYRV
jgi:predicted Holliday junction resolvase-like endonuclease